MIVSTLRNLWKRLRSFTRLNLDLAPAIRTRLRFEPFLFLANESIDTRISQFMIVARFQAPYQKPEANTIYCFVTSIILSSGILSINLL